MHKITKNQTLIMSYMYWYGIENWNELVSFVQETVKNGTTFKLSQIQVCILQDSKDSLIW